MTTINDRITAAVAELERSLEDLPEPEFRPAATRLHNFVIATVAAAVVLLVVAIPVWLTGGNSPDVVDTPPPTTAAPSTTAAPESTNAVRIAELGDMNLLFPVVLDDGTIIARALVSETTDEPPQLGFARSADGGGTWTMIPTDEPPFSSAPGPAVFGEVLVSPVWDGRTGTVSVVTSQDAGLTWSLVELPVPADYLAIGMAPSVVVDEDDRFVVYGGHGKWVSTDGINWDAGLQDTIGRTYLPLPRMINGVLVVAGGDDRIYAAEPNAPLEVVLEPDAEFLGLTASSDTVVASGSISSDSDDTGTWIGVTSDGQTWSEHTSELSFSVVEPLSEVIGAGYLAAAVDPASGTSTAYRSFDLDTWTTVAVLETGDGIGIFDFVEVEGGVLAMVLEGHEPTIWRIAIGQ